MRAPQAERNNEYKLPKSSFRGDTSARTESGKYEKYPSLTAISYKGSLAQAKTQHTTR
ncbi:hypothetical protein Lnau_2439 [Legionella nautarum]|uniref:Uncharacterized protein n=1 Tax=Legionella nautarum TaxID=45070 RepID=A0A0W0WKE3_9GAMM|nr:hypothetical protein Lnau_2439 [Legionella nautarum]